MTDQVPSYLQPQYFLPIFAVAWLGITGLLAHLGGWASLAKKYRAERDEEGERFRFVSGSIGTRFVPVNYGNCLFVTLNDAGIRLSILFPFRFQSPPLLLPWADIEAVSEKRLLFVLRYVVIVMKGHWSRVSLYGRVAGAVRSFHDAHSQKALQAAGHDRSKTRGA